MQGYIKQRSKGSWSLVFYLPPDQQGGKPTQKWVTVKGTKKDAERERARIMHEMNTGSYVEPARITVAEYLERWLGDYAATNVAPKTFERYAEIIHLHLSPALGRHLLAKLQPMHIQAHYTEALASGRRPRRKQDDQGDPLPRTGLSPQTVLHHHRVLREALHQAVRWQLLGRNPVDAVEPPRPQEIEMQAFDESQTATLLGAVDGHRLYAPVLLAVTTGMRRGEILGLRWKDVDLQAATLAVRQSLQTTREGLAFKAPKTKKGRRSISLGLTAIDGLRRHRAGQAKVRLALGAAYQDHDLVCARPDGAPTDPGEVSKGFAALVRQIGLPPIRFHDLRHTHATALMRAGVPPKVVSERLGHSSVGTTLNTYSHVMPGMQEDAAQKVDATLRAALGRAAQR